MMPRAAIIHFSVGQLGTIHSRPQNYYVLFLILFWTIHSVPYLGVESPMAGLLTVLVILCEVNICVSVNAPGDCASVNLNYQSGTRRQWLPVAGHLGWLGKAGFRLWSVVHLMRNWGSAPLLSPRCQLGQAKGSQHQWRKRSGRLLGQRKGAIPEVVGGTQGGWRPRKGKQRDAQLILTNIMIWGN